MKKIIFGIVFGIVFLVSGLIIALVLFEGMFERNPVFLGLASLLIIGGMGLLFYAGTREMPKLHFKDLTVNEEGGVLDKNNKTIAEWNDTSNKRDKLKMAQAASTIEERSKLS
ncbi:MAG: hypothetical protein Q7T54_04690 [Candidatus Levybacteria bacterium]|nr:hypothetical protein [Candidatus Levybacteria bacterium]